MPMLPGQAPLISQESGFTIVELMVALVITMLASIGIYSVFAQSEAQQRTTSETADAWQQARIAMAMLEKDIRNAGYGTPRCSTIFAYNAATGGTTPDMYSIKATTQSSTSPGTYDPASTTGLTTQMLDISYAISPTAGASTALQCDHPSTAANLFVESATGIAVSDVGLLSEPGKPCVLTQVTNVGGGSGGGGSGGSGSGGGATTCGHGTNVVHNSGESIYNAPGGSEDNPFKRVEEVTGTTPAFSRGARFTNLGNLLNVRYYLSDDSTVTGEDDGIPSLIRQTSAFGTGAGNRTAPVSRGILSIQTQFAYRVAGSNPAVVGSYGAWDPARVQDIMSIRIAVLARSTLPDRKYTSPATYALLGGTYTVPASDRRFRHVVLTSEIPLRNLVFNQ